MLHAQQEHFLSLCVCVVMHRAKDEQTEIEAVREIQGEKHRDKTHHLHF